jgi:Rrf2 family protein
MLKLSSRSKYGLKALIELSQSADAAPVPIAQISARQHVSRDYLEQILHKLNRAGIVESVRGPSGGYRMRKAADKVTLSEIVRALERRSAPILCLGETPGEGECGRTDQCLTHFLCAHLENEINKTLDNITLGTIVKEWNHNAKKKRIS